MMYWHISLKYYLPESLKVIFLFVILMKWFNIFFFRWKHILLRIMRITHLLNDHSNFNDHCRYVSWILIVFCWGIDIYLFEIIHFKVVQIQNVTSIWDIHMASFQLFCNIKLIYYSNWMRMMINSYFDVLNRRILSHQWLSNGTENSHLHDRIWSCIDLLNHIHLLF